MSIASSCSLIVPTPQVKDQLVRKYRTTGKKVKIIRNGVELPDLNKSVDSFKAKLDLELEPTQPLIFTIARMVSRKRLDLLIRAIKTLSDEGLNSYHVVIAGDGPDRPNLMALVEKYGLNGIIELPGWISEEQKTSYYQAADIFVLTSDYEGFPFTLLEAMSYEVAVVNSEIQSLNPVRDGVNGLLFPAGDYRALSVCIKKLIADSVLRAQLSHSARLFAKDFSWDKVSEETKNLYQGLINGSK